MVSAWAEPGPLGWLEPRPIAWAEPRPIAWLDHAVWPEFNDVPDPLPGALVHDRPKDSLT